MIAIIAVAQHELFPTGVFLGIGGAIGCGLTATLAFARARFGSAGLAIAATATAAFLLWLQLEHDGTLDGTMAVLATVFAVALLVDARHPAGTGGSLLTLIALGAVVSAVSMLLGPIAFWVALALLVRQVLRRRRRTPDSVADPLKPQ